MVQAAAAAAAAAAPTRRRQQPGRQQLLARAKAKAGAAQGPSLPAAAARQRRHRMQSSQAGPAHGRRRLQPRAQKASSTPRLLCPTAMAAPTRQQQVHRRRAWTSTAARARKRQQPKARRPRLLCQATLMPMQQQVWQRSSKANRCLTQANRQRPRSPPKGSAALRPATRRPREGGQRRRRQRCWSWAPGAAAPAWQTSWVLRGFQRRWPRRQAAGG